MNRPALRLVKFTHKITDEVAKALNRNKLVYFYTAKNTTKNSKCEIVYVGKSSIGKVIEPHKEIFKWYTSFLIGDNRKKLSEIKATDCFSIYILEVKDTTNHYNIEQAFIKILKEADRMPIFNSKVTPKEIETLLQNSEFTTQKDLKWIIKEIETDRADMN